MATPVELIKEKLDVASVIRGYIELSPAGRNFKARCPFHGEKTPSFVVTPDRGSWHCFGCGLGGDIFSFVMRYEHIEFPDALRLLAEKAGVELRRINPAEERFTGVLYRANAAAATFFRDQLAGPVPQAYLTARGISKEAADFFEIGWAPPEQNSLAQYLVREGFAEDDLVRSGLVFASEYGLRDRFRGRLMFPIWSSLGKTVAFTGRIHPDYDTGTLGKYVNSPETPIFSKGKVLYGYGKTKDAIRTAGRALLVEGQIDAVAAWQAGHTNVVAISGTAFTQDHVALLARSAPHIDLAFDADDAGWAAAEKAALMTLQAGLETTVVRWPDGTDAADLARTDPDALRATISQAVPVVEAWTERLLAEQHAFRSAHQIMQLRRILHLIAVMQSPVQRAEWLRYVSRRTGVTEDTLQQEMASMALKTGRVAPVVSTTQPVRTERSRWDDLAEQTLAAAFHDHALSRVRADRLPPSCREVLVLLRQDETASTDPELDAVLQRVVSAPSVVLGSSNLDRLLQELDDCWVAEERARLSGVIADAERFGDPTALAEALAALAALPRR